MRIKHITGGALVLALAALVAIGLWKTACHQPTLVTHEPQAVMGTSCRLIANASATDIAVATSALKEAERVLRNIEARMSNHLDDSEISQLNTENVGQEIPLSKDTLHVLRAAEKATQKTHGAFDATCRPLVERWQNAALRDDLPKQEDLDQTRIKSSWQMLKLTKKGAVRLGPGVRVDLGGIAKGYAIDRVIETLKKAGLTGGLVDVGGDIACFGIPPDGPYWKVGIQHPLEDGLISQIRLTSGAVCTSGDYARFIEIQGKHYSHIIDPRNGQPAKTAMSVTVVAQDAVTADIWATALSVTGPTGLATIPQGIEALILSKDRISCTDGFRNLLIDPLPESLNRIPLQQD